MSTPGPWYSRRTTGPGKGEPFDDCAVWASGLCVAQARTQADADAIAEFPVLVEALRQLLARLDSLTTREFSCGGDREERESARRVLDSISDIGAGV
jgi:hypothetical protein